MDLEGFVVQSLGLRFAVQGFGLMGFGALRGLLGFREGLGF